MTSLEFELTYTPTDVKSYNVPSIRDPQDLPILVSAMVTQPDIFINFDPTKKTAHPNYANWCTV